MFGAYITYSHHNEHGDSEFQFVLPKFVAIVIIWYCVEDRRCCNLHTFLGDDCFIDRVSRFIRAPALILWFLHAEHDDIDKEVDEKKTNCYPGDSMCRVDQSWRVLEKERIYYCWVIQVRRKRIDHTTNNANKPKNAVTTKMTLIVPIIMNA